VEINLRKFYTSTCSRSQLQLIAPDTLHSLLYVSTRPRKWSGGKVMHAVSRHYMEVSGQL